MPRRACARASSPTRAPCSTWAGSSARSRPSRWRASAAARSSRSTWRAAPRRSGSRSRATGSRSCACGSSSWTGSPSTGSRARSASTCPSSSRRGCAAPARASATTRAATWPPPGPSWWGARSAPRRRPWTRSAGWRSCRSRGSCWCRSWSSRAASPRQPQDPLRDDVRLHLGGAARDRAHARPEERLLPAAVLERARRAGAERGVGPLQLERELVEPLRQARPEELHERRLRPRLLAALEARQRAAVHEAHDLDVDPASGDLLANDRIAGASVRARQPHQVLDRDPLQHLLLEGETRAALVGERGHGELPAVVHLADHVRARHAHGVEEDLADLGRAGQLAERADRDARALHIENEVGEAAVLGQRRVGAGEQDRPPGELRVARPHLLAGHHEPVAVGLRAGAERGQVAARAGLAEELAPDLLGREDGREEAALLRLAAVRDEGWAGVVDADAVQELRRAGAGQLLVQDRLLGGARAAPAVLARPEEAQVAGGVEPLLPVAQEGDLRGQRGVVVRHALGAHWPVGGEPGAQLPAEALVSGGEGEVHDGCACLSIPGPAIASAVEEGALETAWGSRTWMPK